MNIRLTHPLVTAMLLISTTQLLPLCAQLPTPVHPVNTETAQTDANHDTNPDKKSNAKSHKESGAHKEKVQAKSDAKPDAAPKQKLTKQQLRNYLKNILTGIGLTGAVLIMVSNDALNYLFGKTSQAASSAGEQSAAAAQSWFKKLTAPSPSVLRKQAEEKAERERNQRSIAQGLLYLQAARGHFESIDDYVAEGVDVNYRSTPAHKSMLMYAAQHGNSLAVLALVARNANVNVTTYNGSALTLATIGNHHAVVENLVEAQADVDVEDEDKSTPLSIAASKGYLQIAATLLAHNANVDKADDEKRTPLIMAAKNGHQDMVQMLVTHRANLDCADHDGVTAVARAVYSNHIPVVQVLLEHKASLQVASERYYPPIIYAAKIIGSTDMLQTLLNHKADPNITDDKKRTALMKAAEKNQGDALRLLLDNNADIDAADERGYTALTVATKEGHENIVRILIERKANIEAQDKDGCTALMEAVDHKNANMIALLLAHKANIHATNSDGDTPLHYAARTDRSDLVQDLLRYNADPHAMNNLGINPLMQAALSNQSDLLPIFLEKGVPIDAVDSEGSTALALAAALKSPEAVKTLLAHRADPNATRTKINWTPLHAATRKGLYQEREDAYCEIAEALLNANANIHAKNSDDYCTPLHCAADAGCQKTILLLLDHEADPNAKDKVGRKPRQYASTEEIRQLLGGPAEEPVAAALNEEEEIYSENDEEQA